MTQYLFWRDIQNGLLTGVGGITLGRNLQSGLLTGTTLAGVTTSNTYNEFGEISASNAVFGIDNYNNSGKGVRSCFADSRLQGVIL